MITQQQAERIAQSVSVLRPDWLASSITTLIVRDLATWPLLDAAVGLTYVALDRKTDGSWASKTPARVKEQGPWRIVGMADPEAQVARERQRQIVEANRQHAAERLLDVDDCGICDDVGRLENGNLCWHDERSLPGYRSPGAALARKALAEARSSRQPEAREAQ